MDLIPAGHALALWSALHLLLLLGLSLLVVRQRRRHGVALGDGDVAELACAIRAFGNASEYIPMGLVGLTSLTLAGAPGLGLALSGEVNVNPAGEPVVEIPLALAVAQQDQAGH